MFESLLSNTNMKRQLTRMVKEDKPLQAYLFIGAKGSGKKTAALELAKALVGVNPDKADRGSHPDIITVAPEPNKKIITVDKIRNMRADAFVKPSEGKRKIYIIDGAHLLKDEGQNALLTILEQPPSFAVFILLSESLGKILPTVISRCILFEMEPADTDEGVAFLLKKHSELSPSTVRAAMLASDGNIGMAYRLASGEDFNKNAVACTKLLKSASRGDAYTVGVMLSKMSKDALFDFLPLLALYIKDILMYRQTENPTRLVFKTGVLQNKAEFDKIDINILYGTVRACEEAMELINGNVSLALITASLTVRLCGGIKD